VFSNKSKHVDNVVRVFEKFREIGCDTPQDIVDRKLSGMDLCLKGLSPVERFHIKAYCEVLELKSSAEATSSRGVSVQQVAPTTDPQMIALNEKADAMKKEDVQMSTEDQSQSGKKVIFTCDEFPRLID
jgi:hypothetical protein